MTDLKNYRKEYYKRRYSEDPLFRQKKQESNRKAYNRKTKDCTKCGVRLNKTYAPEECEACKYGHIPQIKSKRGRPKKEPNDAPEPEAE